MVFKRKYSGRRYGSGKRRRIYGRRRRIRSTRRLARRAYRGVKRISRLIETKFGEGYFATTATNVAGSFNPLTIAVNANQGGRIGNQVTLTSFCMKLGLTVADSTNYVRVVVLIDKDNYMGGNYAHNAYLQNTGAPI